MTQINRILLSFNLILFVHNTHFNDTRSSLPYSKGIYNPRFIINTRKKNDEIVFFTKCLYYLVLMYH